LKDLTPGIPQIVMGDFNVDLLFRKDDVITRIFDFKGVLFFLNQWIGDEKLFQGNSDIMIDSCTYIYIQVSIIIH
jgi:hypothetical protein